MKKPLLIAASALLVLGFGCRKPAPVAPPAVSRPAPEPAGQDAVVISGSAYAPADLTVRSGATVVFRNRDGMAHTVTSDAKGFDSGLIAPNGEYAHTFATPGTYAYHCKIHPSMHGTVTVR